MTSLPLFPRQSKVELTAEQKLEKSISSTTDSETLIRKLVEEKKYNEQIHNTITRNIKHIEIIIGKDEVANSGSEKLVDFQEAIDLGTAFIAAESAKLTVE